MSDGALLALQALLAGGILTFLREIVVAIVKRRRETSPEAKNLASLGEAQQSILVVAQARDELMEDNTRLREQISELRQQQEADRLWWDKRDQAQRSELSRLEGEIDKLRRDLRQLQHGSGPQ